MWNTLYWTLFIGRRAFTGDDVSGAYYKEIGARDPEAALKMYENILVRYSENRQLAAKTQLRIGECYEKLGKAEEAAKAFRKVIEQFPSEQEVVKKAKEKYASLAKEGTLTAVVDRLINSLKYGDFQVKTAAATALGMIGDERAVESLLEVLKKGEGITLASIRPKIVEALERIGGEKALEALDKLWSSETPESNRIKKVERDVKPSKKVDNLDMLLERMVSILSDDDSTSMDKRAAIVTLGMVGDKRAVKLLLGILGKDEESYMDILEAFGRIKDPEVVPVLLKMLERKNTTMDRILIASTLGEIGDKRAVPALKKMLEETKGKKNLISGLLIRDALAKITGGDYGDTVLDMKDIDMDEFVSDLLGEEFGELQKGAHKALKKAREQVKQVTCLSNLKQIGMALHMYAVDYDEKFPEKLDDLYPNYVSKPGEIFKCPSTGLIYSYIPGLTNASDPDSILAFDKKDNHKGGRNVIFVAGHVKWMKEEEFQKALKETIKNLPGALIKE